jgi:hypothetical protein
VVGLGREMRRLAPEMALAGCACWRRGCLGAALPCQCRSHSHSRQAHDTYLLATTPQQLGSLGERGAGEKRGGGEEWRSVRDPVARTKMKSLVRLRPPTLHLLDRQYNTWPALLHYGQRSNRWCVGSAPMLQGSSVAGLQGFSALSSDSSLGRRMLRRSRPSFCCVAVH